MGTFRLALLPFFATAFAACSDSAPTPAPATDSLSAAYVCKLGPERPVNECLCTLPSQDLEGEDVSGCPASLTCCLRGSSACGCFDLAAANGRPEPGPGDPPLKTCQQILEEDEAAMNLGLRVVDSCGVVRRPDL